MPQFYVNVTQKAAKPLPAEAAMQMIAALAVWEVHCPSVDEVLDAIRLQERYRLLFWDALVIISAVQLGCQILWSEDLNPGQVYDQIEVQNPF